MGLFQVLNHKMFSYWLHICYHQLIQDLFESLLLNLNYYFAEPTQVDGGYSEFSDWTVAVCTETCGGGTRMRTRTCTDPAPANGGAGCEGVDSETQTCNTQTCTNEDGEEIEPGNFTDYGAWSACSTECGGGVQTRTRICSDPARPTSHNRGASCKGVPVETTPCNEQACKGK